MFFDRGNHRVAFEWEYEVGSHHEFAWLRYARLRVRPVLKLQESARKVIDNYFLREMVKPPTWLIRHSISFTWSLFYLGHLTYLCWIFCFPMILFRRRHALELLIIFWMHALKLLIIFCLSEKKNKTFRAH